MNVVIQKTERPPRLRKKLRKGSVVEMPVRTGIFEDLASYDDFRRRWKNNKDPRRVTFWD